MWRKVLFSYFELFLLLYFIFVVVFCSLFEFDLDVRASSFMWSIPLLLAHGEAVESCLDCLAVSGERWLRFYHDASFRGA